MKITAYVRTINQPYGWNPPGQPPMPPGASGALLAQITPASLCRESSPGYGLAAQSALYQSAMGSSRGLALPKLTTNQLIEYYNGIWVVPDLVDLATGLTHTLILTDDRSSSLDLGKTVRIGITPFNLSVVPASVDWSLAASRGTETFASVTLGATTGLPILATFVIAAANLAGLITGGIYGIRIRRVGDNAADTCNGRVLILGGMITNT